MQDKIDLVACRFERILHVPLIRRCHRILLPDGTRLQERG